MGETRMLRYGDMALMVIVSRGERTLVCRSPVESGIRWLRRSTVARIHLRS